MKKTVAVLVAVLSLVSCDYILKKQEPTANGIPEDTVVAGGEMDKNGCAASAGYRWSVIKNDCFRPVEEAYRLNPSEKVEDESPVKSAFVIFDEDHKKAELFLPDTADSILLVKEGENVFKAKGWSLHSDNGYTLKKSGQLLYEGAEPVKEGQVTGDENEES